jgi:hypothetical protein
VLRDAPQGDRDRRGGGRAGVVGARGLRLVVDLMPGTSNRRFAALLLSFDGTYELQSARLTMREVNLMLAAEVGAAAVSLLRADCSLDAIVMNVRTAWGCALDALGWRES